MQEEGQEMGEGLGKSSEREEPDQSVGVEDDERDQERRKT